MRYVRGLLALFVLLGGVFAVPWALWVLGGNPLPQRLSGADLVDALLRPDDGTILIGLITIVGWVAWLIFALSTLAELVAVLSRQRIRIRLPGLGAPQRAVGSLVILVVAMLAVVPNSEAHADPSTRTPSPSPGVTRSAEQTPGRDATTASSPSSKPSPSSQSSAGPRSRSAEPERQTDPQAEAADHTGPQHERSRSADDSDRLLVHEVERGDDLWSLAERFYGHGSQWRVIARANPDLLTDGPDRLEPGWRLRIPNVATGDRAPSGAKSAAAWVEVREGDSLSAIAEREYGDENAWPGLFRANRAEIGQPDLIKAGQQLRVPDVVHTGAGRFVRKDSGSQQEAGSRARAAAKHSGAPAGQTGPAGRTDPDSPRTPAPVPSRAPSQAPSQTASADQGGRPDSPAGESTADQRTAPVPVSVDDESTSGWVVAGVGGLLAAGLVGGLAARRRLQLHTRPVGRRIAQPARPAQLVETRLGSQQTPLDLDVLDRLLRSVGLHCQQHGAAVPLLVAARVAEQQIELIFDEPPPQPPVGLVMDDHRWLLESCDAGYLAKLPGIDEAPQPYPALCAVGSDLDGRQLLVNLEATRLLSVSAVETARDRSISPTGPLHGFRTAVEAAGEEAAGVEPIDPSAVLAAMTADLSFCRWADELVLTVIGGPAGLVDALDRHSVSRLPGTREDIEQLLARWNQRAATQRRHLEGGGARSNRIDPDLADPWVPEIALIDGSLDADQQHRLEELLQADPPVTMAAVIIQPSPGAWQIDLAAGPGQARLSPLDWTFRPQHLSRPVEDAVTELVAATGAEQTDPAPWWRSEQVPDDSPSAATPAGVPRRAVEERIDPTGPGRAAGLDPRHAWPSSPLPARAHLDADGDPTQNVTFIGAHAARRSASEESAIVLDPTAVSSTVRHPTVHLLGPIDLVGAAGSAPSRATKQCVEYCTWLLEHPGRTAQAMAVGLAVAEGTRRSNMSRLRAWLGLDEEGNAYLPDAYSGRITLSPVVSSDWHRLQLLTGTGVNATSTEGLIAALGLVRGAPLADAAPGQWHWAEELRTDMVSVIRDIGVELSNRALADKELDLARWAAARSLTAAPHDERLISAQIRAEHQAGNLAGVERLALQMSAHARHLGIDLDPETVDLLQQVMEGQLRARA